MTTPDQQPQVGLARDEILEHSFTRRRFLQLALVAFGLVSCGVVAPSAPPSPSLVSVHTPGSEPTPQPDPTAETQRPIFITEELLMRGLGSIGGEKLLLPTPVPSLAKATATPSEISSYASVLWFENFSFSSLGKDGVEGVKYLATIPEYQATPEEQWRIVNFADTFPALKDEKGNSITLARITINGLPENGPEISWESGVFPPGLTMRTGTHLTVFGQYTNTQGEKRLIVVFDDFVRSKDNSPRLYLADLPTATIQSLLEKNSAYFNNAEGKIILPDKEEWLINDIDRSFAEKLSRAGGCYFVDKQGTDSSGKPILHPNPVVPYPQVDLIGQTTIVGYRQLDDGRVVALGQEGQTPVFQATFDGKKRSWVWEEYKKPYQLELTPIELNPQLVADYIAGGEFVETRNSYSFFQLIGPDGKTQSTVIVPEKIKEALLAQLSAAEKTGLSNSQLNVKLAELLAKSQWAETYLAFTSNPKLSEGTRSMNIQEMNLMIFCDGGIIYTPKTHGLHAPDGRKTFIDVPNPQVLLKPSVMFDVNLGIVGTDGYVISHQYDIKNNQWQELAEYVPLGTVQERMGKALKELQGTLGLNPTEVDLYIKTGSDKGLKSFRILVDAMGQPALILVTGGKYGLKWDLGRNPSGEQIPNNITAFSEAVARLNEIDPTIIEYLVIQYGLRAIAGDVPPSNFTAESSIGSSNDGERLLKVNERNRNLTIIFSSIEDRRVEVMFRLLGEGREIVFYRRSGHTRTGAWQTNPSPADLKLGIRSTTTDNYLADETKFIDWWFKKQTSRLTPDEKDRFNFWINFLRQWILSHP